MELEQKALTRMGKATYQKATMRDINRVIIEPQCKETGKSYALTLNPKGLMIDAFITHAWDEPFPAFVESVRHVFHAFMDRPNLWICACALFQGDSNAIAAQIAMDNDSLESTPFVQALSKASSYVVVRNSTVDVYSQIWCVAELLHSKNLGLIPDRAFVTGPDNFSALNTSCLDAQAFDPDDRDKMLRALLNNHASKEIDEIIHQFRVYEPPRKTKPRGFRRIALGVASAVIVTTVILAGALAGLNNSKAESPTTSPTTNPTTLAPSVTPGFPSMSPTTQSPTTQSPTTQSPTTRSPTLSPTTAASIMENLPAYTLASLNDSASPQYRALDWLTKHPKVNTFEDWRKKQIFALVAFYYAFNGEEWPNGRYNHWADYAQEAECEWSFAGDSDSDAHVTCNTANRVNEIFVSKMAGFQPQQGRMLPPEVSFLTSLESLSIRESGLIVAELGDLIPYQLESLPKLTSLDFYANGPLLKGSIPDSIGSFIGLKRLLLQGNGLTSTIPTTIGLLTSLTDLQQEQFQQRLGA